MNFLRMIFYVFLLTATIFAQNPDELHVQVPVTVQNEEESEQIYIILPDDVSVNGADLIETNAQRIGNHRRIVVSAVMMMMFAGLAMASVSTLNPE